MNIRTVIQSFTVVVFLSSAVMGHAEERAVSLNPDISEDLAAKIEARLTTEMKKQDEYHQMAPTGTQEAKLAMTRERATQELVELRLQHNRNAVRFH